MSLSVAGACITCGEVRPLGEGGGCFICTVDSLAHGGTFCCADSVVTFAVMAFAEAGIEASASDIATALKTALHPNYSYSRRAEEPDDTCEACTRWNAMIASAPQ